MEDRVVGRAGRHAVGRVDRAAHLRIGAGPVDDQLVALDGHGDVESHRRIDDAVVLHVLGELVDAVRDGLDLGPHPALGVVHELVRGLLDELAAEAVEQLDHAPLGDPQRADLRVEVAPRVPRRAVVGHDQPPQVHVVDVALDDLDRRDPQALLEDLGGVRGEAADGLAADLGEMADVGHEAEQLALVEDRAHDAVLGDVRAAAVGIVVQDDVAGLERLDAELLDRPAHDEQAGRDLRRAELGLPDHVPRRSKSTHEKSRPSLKIGENAVRIIVIPISRQMFTKLLLTIVRVTGSIIGA